MFSVLVMRWNLIWDNFKDSLLFGSKRELCYQFFWAQSFRSLFHLAEHAPRSWGIVRSTARQSKASTRPRFVCARKGGRSIVRSGGEFEVELFHAAALHSQMPRAFDLVRMVKVGIFASDAPHLKITNNVPNLQLSARTCSLTVRLTKQNTRVFLSELPPVRFYLCYNELLDDSQALTLFTISSFFRLRSVVVYKIVMKPYFTCTVTWGSAGHGLSTAHIFMTVSFEHGSTERGPLCTMTKPKLMILPRVPWDFETERCTKPLFFEQSLYIPCVRSSLHS